MLKFLGRGAGFSDQHNGACFGYGRKLILMDCPLVTFNRLKNEGLSKFVPETEDDSEVEELVVAVTHTHSDHVAGLALTIHLATFVWNKHVTVIAPSDEVKADLRFLLDRLDGCDENFYTLKTYEEYKSDNANDTGWIKAVIATKHVPRLEGRCFGWVIQPEGTRIVFTGDTTTLEPFMPYLEKGTYLYTDASAHDCVVHMHIKDLEQIIPELRRKGVQVYFMHLDDEQLLGEAARKTGVQLAPLHT